MVHSLLRELSTLLDGLAADASAFMSSLQRTIDLQDVDEDAFIACKDRLSGDHRHSPARPEVIAVEGGGVFQFGPARWTPNPT